MSLSAVVLGGAAGSAAAEVVVNGGFESGGFAVEAEGGGLIGFETIGVARVETAAFGAAVPGGTFAALIETGDGGPNSLDTPFIPAVGGSGEPVASAELEAFFGLSAGAFDGLVLSDSGGLAEAFEGSAIRQTIDAGLGGTLAFDFNFLTDELEADDGVIDFAFVVVGGEVTVLASADPLLTDTFSASPTPFADETGFGTFATSFGGGGELTFGFGVIDVEDGAVASGVLIDNIVVELAPLPAPTGVAVVGTLGALALGRRRR